MTKMAEVRPLLFLTIFGLFGLYGLTDGQRLSQGASDWYMRFHSNYVKYKRNFEDPEAKSFIVTSKVQRSYAVTTVTMKVHNPAIR